MDVLSGVGNMLLIVMPLILFTKPPDNTINANDNASMQCVEGR